MRCLIRVSTVTMCWMLACSQSLFSQNDAPKDLLPKQVEQIHNYQKLGKISLNQVETEHLRLLSSLPTERLTKLSNEAQRCYISASKALGYEGKPNPIPGKLTLFVFTDSKSYKSFLLQGMKRSPRGRASEERELSSDVPLIVLNAAAETDKPTEADIIQKTCKQVASALLIYKAGMTTGEDSLPGWLEDGFSEIAYLKADGNAAKWNQYRANLKSLTTKTRGAALQYQYVWGDGANINSEAELVALSFVEFLVYGPGSDKFNTILTNLKPIDGNENPSISQALAAVEWTMEATELNWRKWVITGK